MKLAHPLLSSPIAFCENQIPVLVLENAAAFREFAVELLQQSEGQEGAFVLSRADRCLDCAEHLNVFLDFLHPPELEKTAAKQADHGPSAGGAGNACRRNPPVLAGRPGIHGQAGRARGLSRGL